MDKQTTNHNPNNALINAVEPQNSAEVSTQTPTNADFSDFRIPKYIRGFLQATKPDGVSLVEVSYIQLLLTFKAIDQAVSFSHTTIALMLNCDDRTVKRAEKNLIYRGWINVTSRRGMSKLTSVNLAALPMVDRTLSNQPCEDAVELRKFYLQSLIKRRFKRPHKKQLLTQDWNAQKIVNRCKGDVALASQMIEHALESAEHVKAARNSLSALWKRWKYVEKSFAKLNSISSANAPVRNVPANVPVNVLPTFSTCDPLTPIPVSQVAKPQYAHSAGIFIDVGGGYRKVGNGNCLSNELAEKLIRERVGLERRGLEFFSIDTGEQIDWGRAMELLSGKPYVKPQRNKGVLLQ